MHQQWTLRTCTMQQWTFRTSNEHFVHASAKELCAYTYHGRFVRASVMDVSYMYQQWTFHTCTNNGSFLHAPSIDVSYMHQQWTFFTCTSRGRFESPLPLDSRGHRSGKNTKIFGQKRGGALQMRPPTPPPCLKTSGQREREREKEKYPVQAGGWVERGGGGSTNSKL